jgi:FKBP-type peptidyl-prolyl cis-trans isomerase FkpA
MQRRLRIWSFTSATLVVLAALGACSNQDGFSTAPPPPASVPATETYAASLGVNIASMTKINDNLYIKDLVVGSGVVVLANHSASVFYTGWLTNGTQFDTDIGVGKTELSFLFGTGAVIAGWDQGMLGMRVGGTRLIVVGSTLGYGFNGLGSIPPSATLVFNVQVTSVQ